MAGADHVTPVHFACTGAAPYTVSPGDLVFYSIVPGRITRRSRVLSCIAEAGGGAHLPEAVSIAEFRTWVTACHMDESEQRRIELDTLCTVLKVADAIDDQHMAEWAKLAVGLLTTMHARPFWHSNRVTEQQPSSFEVERKLLQLPHLVQHQIFSAACARFPVCDLLAWLPPGLHPGVLAAAISSPDKTLKVSLPADARPLLMALAALSASPPPILSLQVICCPWQSDRMFAKLCATALSHHSGLTSLSFYKTPKHHSVRDILLAPIATLTSLQSLQLGDSTRHSYPPASIPTIQHALQSLPQLKHLCVSLELGPRRLKQKRKRGGVASATPGRCLAAMLSAASGLTSLTLGLHTGGVMFDNARGEWAFGDSSTPIVLPHLSHLTARIQDCGCAAALLRRLGAAPLTSLGFKSYICPSHHSRLAHTYFVESLEAFTHLRSLQVASGSQSWELGALSEALVTVSVVACPAPQGVQVLQLEGCFPWVSKAVAHLAVGMPRLQRLTLLIRGDCLEASDAEQAAWEQLAERLRHLQLQQLALSYHGGMGHCGTALSALCPLTCLSALQLAQLDTSWDVVALSRLTRLQFLHVHDCTLPEESRAAFVPSLCALRSLTNLALSGPGVPEALAAGGAAQQLRGAWPALRVLGIHVALSRPEVELQPLARAVCGLPALQRLVLMHDGDHTGTQGLAGSIQPKLEALLQIASESGVTMTAGPHDPLEGFSNLDDVFELHRT